ncbi:MAG: PAS domain S-box protein [Chloroflexi bacterium]|nr:PAS domain S-box protein [Chloroflexota bacterium]
MKRLYDLIADNEDRLARRVLQYAGAHGYVKYTSATEEPWRRSVAGLSECLLAALQSNEQPLEFSPDDDLKKDPVAAFGITEARKHRQRGGTLELFFGLMTYFRQSYIDLVLETGLKRNDEQRYLRFIERFFDRLKLGFCTQWAETSDSKRVAELQAANQAMANAASGQHALFESLPSPVILMDHGSRIDNMNRAAVALMRDIGALHSSQVKEMPVGEALPWLAEELHAFVAGSESEARFEKHLQTLEVDRDFQIQLTRMEDAGGDFSGTVAILTDITALKQAQRAATREKLLNDAILNNMPAGVAFLDNAFILRKYNHAHAEMIRKYTSYSPEQALGMSYFDYLPGSQPQVEEWFRRVRNTGQAETRHDFRLTISVNGREQTIRSDTSVAAMVDAAGKVEGILILTRDTTDYQRAEDMLRTSEDRYHTLVENADDAIFVKDAEGRFTKANSELARRVSRRKEDVIGKTAWELFPPETARRIANEESKVLKQGVVVESEHEYATPWGQMARSVRKVPLRDDAGAVIGLVGIARDTTERKRAAEALRRSEEHLRSLTESVSDIVAVLSQAGAIQSISPSVERALGYRPEEMVGKSLLELAHPEEAANLESVFAQVLQCPGAAASAEMRGRHKDGSYRVLEVALSNHLSNPAVGGIICKIVDATEHRKAEEALAKARDFYLTLLDEFPAPIWRSGTDAKCYYFNKSWLMFTGKTLEQEIGDGWMEGVHPDDLDRRMKAYLDAFNARRPYEAEYRLRRHDGEYRWMVDIGRLYCDPDGNFAGYIGSCYDVTDRKMQEQQLGYLATHDPLTRLPNRRLLEDALSRAVARARRGTRSALLFLDLDDFKFVNDTFGHTAGDQVLIATARLLQEHLRAEDLLARFAGDEFAVLLEGTEVDEARSIAERNRRKVEEHTFSVGGHEFHLSVSTGVVAIDGREGPEFLMSHADNAMYTAKDQGRNRVVLYHPDGET